MAWLTHPATAEILRIPGYLFWNPSGLASEAQWGTKLGYCEKGVEVDIAPQTGLLGNEEYGEEPIYKVFLGTIIKVTAILKNYNATALARLFPGQTSGATIEVPGATIKAGHSLVSGTYTDHLLFIPDDTTNNPIMILQKAAPNAIASMKFSRVDDTTFICVFDGLRKTNDADGLIYIGAIGGGMLR